MNEQTLDRIYAAALDDLALHEALVETAYACGAKAAGLFRVRGDNLDWERSVEMPEGFMDDYTRHQAAHDPRIEHILKFPECTVLHDALPEVRRAMQACETDRFVERYDLPYTVGAILLRDNHEFWNFYVTRGRRQGWPDGACLAALERRVPHFARSLRLRRFATELWQAPKRNAPGRAALRGRTLIDHQGLVRWADAGAERISAHTGIVRIARRLTCTSTAAAAWLDRGLSLARARRRPDWHMPAFELDLKCPPGLLKLALFAHPGAGIPGPGRIDGTGRGIFLSLQWWSAHDLSIGAIHLTPRQRQVVHHLAAGRGSRDIAARLGCAHSTVRNHAQALLRLFGVDNRVRMLEKARAAGFLNH